MAVGDPLVGQSSNQVYMEWNFSEKSLESDTSKVGDHLKFIDSNSETPILLIDSGSDPFCVSIP